VEHPANDHQTQGTKDRDRYGATTACDNCRDVGEAVGIRHCRLEYDLALSDEPATKVLEAVVGAPPLMR
jgi:hypothetical protein